MSAVDQQEHENLKERRKRQVRTHMVYNNWELYGFMQMFEYMCLLFGKELSRISEHETSKTCHACT